MWYSTRGSVAQQLREYYAQLQEVDHEVWVWREAFSLHGMTPKLKMIDSSSLQKVNGEDVQLFMIKVTPKEVNEARQKDVELVEIQQVL